MDVEFSPIIEGLALESPNALQDDVNNSAIDKPYKLINIPWSSSVRLPIPRRVSICIMRDNIYTTIPTANPTHFVLRLFFASGWIR